MNTLHEKIDFFFVLNFLFVFHKNLPVERP